MYVTTLHMPLYLPFRFYLTENTVYRNCSDEATALSKAAWNHDLAHNPYFKDLFDGVHYQGTRCNKVPCCGCERWYGPRDVLVFDNSKNTSLKEVRTGLPRFCAIKVRASTEMGKGMHVWVWFDQITYCTNAAGGRFNIYTTDDREMHHVHNCEPYALKPVYSSTSYQKCIGYCRRKLCCI